MAKKKESISFEERLEKALVPDWEQPYNVPSNWVWTRGNTIFIPNESKKPYGDKFYYIDIDSIDNKNQKIREPKLLEVSKAPSRASRGLNTGDTIFSIVRPYLKNIAYIDETFQYAIASTGFYVCRPNKIQPRFLYWLMCSGYVVDGLNKFMKGDNSPSIRKENIENFAYPIPPLAEQERIVDRIESLFSKLDEAKEKAQTALDSFENRKAAILNKAFTGELTKKWREENGISMESWDNKKIKNISRVVRGGSPRPAGDPQYYDGTIPFMKVADITNNNSMFVTQTVYTIKEAGLKKTRMVSANTLLLTNSGATLGVPAITMFETTFNDGIAAFLELNENISFMYYFWISKIKELRAINKGAAQPNLNTEIIGNVDIHLPNLLEQAEIVRILDAFLEKEKQAKELISVIEKIDIMKKAILARAFRGELGTNNPEEESSLEFLKEMLSKVNVTKQKPNKKQLTIPNIISKQFKTDLEEQIYRVILENQNSTLNHLLSGVSSSKHLDAMEVITNLYEKGLIEKKDNLYYTK